MILYTAPFKFVSVEESSSKGSASGAPCTCLVKVSLASCLQSVHCDPPPSLSSLVHQNMGRIKEVRDRASAGPLSYYQSLVRNSSSVSRGCTA